MNTQIASSRTRTNSSQINRSNETLTDSRQISQNNISTHDSSPTLLPPPRNPFYSMIDDMEQSFNRFLMTSLSFKEQRVDEIVQLSKIITPKTANGNKNVASYALNTDIINHSSDTKIIIPLVQIPLPIFKIETRDKCLGKKNVKSSAKGMRKRDMMEIEKEETNERNILINEIEKDKDKDSMLESEVQIPTQTSQPLVQTSQSNVYNVNITNVNINYNNSTPNKNIIKEIKNNLLEKGLKYDSTHQKDSKDLKFSIGDYGYLIRQDQENKKFLCFVRTFNYSNRDKEVVLTNDSDIIRELKTLKEDLKKIIRK